MTDELRPAAPEAWFGVIQAGARGHETTAQIWDRIRGYAADNNYSIPSDMFSQVNRMRGIASDLAYSSERLMAADRGDVIGPEFVGQQIYQRGAAELNDIAAMYHIRFELVTNTAGVESTDWRNFEYPGSLPASVGDLYDEIESYGQGLSDAYGTEFVGIGNIEIGAF